jgi:hypothetical protein
MPPDSTERRLRAESGVQEDARGDGTTGSVTDLLAAFRDKPPAPRAELRQLPHGRWFGGILYDAAKPQPPGHASVCTGEFGPDGRLRPHCRDCA